MFKKLLVSNRGEIALRIIRACRELEIQSVAVYSEIDRDSLHVRYADESVCVGPPEPGLSYHNVPNILSAAEITGAEAIHPGYGFLAENAQFAEACEAAGIKFVGPSAGNIALMADKASAREHMTRQGVPIVPGSPGRVTSEQQAREVARDIGYPLIIKAAAGGGGRGLRVVSEEGELTQLFQTSQAESMSVFGDAGVYIEKYFLEPRHIEIQILADEKGNTVYFAERDCSIQRRHQKILEESPSSVVDELLRQEMGKTAVHIAREVGYVNAGTVEFLLTEDMSFYFMEMNTRIQVEHPVSEMVSGIDLIKEQIRIASGIPLAMKQGDIRTRGHSIECRINAECPEKLTPSAGRVTHYSPPGGFGVRVDSALYSDCVIPPQYDSMIAKLIVHDEQRSDAIARMRHALDEFVVVGVKTNIPLHKIILDHPDFLTGNISTRFLEGLVSGTAKT